MTDESRGQGDLVGPPWSVDLLAALHAGVLDEREAARLWPRVRADPEANAILDALDSTADDLAGLAAAEPGPVPADVADRIGSALERERAAHGTAPAHGTDVVGIDAARRRRTRRLGWTTGLLTAAAAVLAAVAVVVPDGADDSSAWMAEDPGRPSTGAPAGTAGPDRGPALALTRDDPGAAVGEVHGVRDFGPLGSEARLDTCLEANGIDPDRATVGVRPATVDGREAVLVLYTTGELAQFRLIALPADCGPGDSGLLMDRTVGGTGG